ncbi:MAG: hypothetical protein FWB73_00345 [Treponema sp.]|nr:hypothetical protein [Treponema sp.]
MDGNNVVFAASLKNKVVITLSGIGPFYFERLKQGHGAKWEPWTDSGFSSEETATPLSVSVGDFLDNRVETGVYAYRSVPVMKDEPKDTDYSYSNFVRCGEAGPIGWSFGNYTPPPGQWGEICTPDDLRYTWIFGTDFKATNGQIFTDEQILYYIENATAEIERRLNITIRKKRVRCNPKERGYVKGRDYDIEDAVYDFKLSKIQRYGVIATRYHPICELHRIEQLSRIVGKKDITSRTIADKRKGLLKLLERPLRQSETVRGIQTAINMYGSETMSQHLFYEIDYDAGFDSAADVPHDIREAVSKSAAIALLNVIGDGLMSGFSSSSLSMDGLSESFSSTQCATSAYFGARVKVYQDELEKYVNENKRKLGNLPMGSL